MKKIVSFLAIAIFLFACQTKKEEDVFSVKTTTWKEIKTISKGKTVTLMMWQGDPLINKFMADYVVPRVKEKYDIILNIIDGQGNEIVNTLMTEIEVGEAVSAFDMMWINGETFYQLRQINALFGPFTNKLPNNKYINWENPFINTDFQQQVGGFECPWGNVQLALIYNSEKIPAPPMDLQNLAAWVKSNPGKFTMSNDFTGMTLLKSWLIYFSGGKGSLNGAFDEIKYKISSQKLWNYINSIKPYFWNQGETFPNSVAQMHQLFANDEIWFTMSNNDSEVDNKISEGLFNYTSKAYVFDAGTIQNSHYMGIVKHSANKEAAMVVVNFLISPEAQYQKMMPKVWGDATVLAIEKLPINWQHKFAAIPNRENSPIRDEINKKALMEPAPEYMIRLFEDFRANVIEQ